MRSRAYDMTLVVHMTPYKGAALPACFVAEEADETQSMPVLSPMWLPAGTPLTCVRCVMLETQLQAEESASAVKAEEEDDA